MKKKVFQIISILLIIGLIFINSISLGAQAQDSQGTKSTIDPSVREGETEGSDIIAEGKNFTEATPVITIEEVISKVIPIGRILVAIATGVVIIVGLIMGLKYMIAGADEKANLKEKLIWYIISIAIIFGAVSIVTIITKTMQSVIG